MPNKDGRLEGVFHEGFMYMREPHDRDCVWVEALDPPGDDLDGSDTGDFASSADGWEPPPGWPPKLHVPA
jgi:hypothetical protein